MAKLTKKAQKEILSRYNPPKGASVEEIKRLRKNAQAALWREANRDKVRQSQKAYAAKRKEAEKELKVQLEEPEKAKETVIPLTDGPLLMYEALSYGSKVTGAVNAAWIEAEANNRRVIGLISDFENKIRGPYFTLTAFTAAIQEVYQQGLKGQANYKIDKKDLKEKGPKHEKYPLVDASFSDDGKTVLITVNCEI